MCVICCALMRPAGQFEFDSRVLGNVKQGGALSTSYASVSETLIEWVSLFKIVQVSYKFKLKHICCHIKAVTQAEASQ